MTMDTVGVVVIALGAVILVAILYARFILWNDVKLWEQSILNVLRHPECPNDVIAVSDCYLGAFWMKKPRKEVEKAIQNLVSAGKIVLEEFEGRQCIKLAKLKSTP